MNKIRNLTLFCFAIFFAVAAQASQLSVKITNNLLGYTLAPITYSPGNAMYYCPPPQIVESGPNVFKIFNLGCTANSQVADIPNPQVTYSVQNKEGKSFLTCTLEYYLDSNKQCVSHLFVNRSTTTAGFAPMCKMEPPRPTDGNKCSFGVEFYPAGQGKP